MKPKEEPCNKQIARAVLENQRRVVRNLEILLSEKVPGELYRQVIRSVTSDVDLTKPDLPHGWKTAKRIAKPRSKK